jgi:hypothetical protein
MHSAGGVIKGQEKSGIDVVMQADRHAVSRKGKQRTGKVRNRCSDAGRQTCIQQERQTEGQEKIPIESLVSLAAEDTV